MNEETLNLIKTIILVAALIPFIIELIALMLSVKYQGIAKNPGNMDHEAFRALKLRYSNCAKLGIPIKNTKCFVEKSLTGKASPLGKMILADRIGCVLFSLVLAVSSFSTIYSANTNLTDFTYSVMAFSFCFYLFRQACAVDKKADHIVTLTADYLENTLSHRLNPSSETTRRQDPGDSGKSSDKKETPPSSDNTPKQCTTGNSISNKESKKDSSDIIESVLQEFLP